MTMTLTEIAKFVGGEMQGNGSITIRGVATVEDAEEGHLSMVSDPRFDSWIKKTKASALLLYRDAPACEKPNIRVDSPDLALLQAIELLHPQQSPYLPGIHQTAVLGEEIELGKDVSIQAHAVIGNRVKLGDGVIIFPCTVIGDDCEVGSHSLLYANVTLRERTVLGKNVIVHSGAVIGSDGFGYIQSEGKHRKIPQIGRVVIEDDVEIGANTTIDRAKLKETRIKRGTKLDNLIHVAHNAMIGQNVIMAAQVGVSGSTEIGDNVMVGGQVGFVDHIKVGDNISIGAQSGVSKNLSSNAVYFGSPARPLGEAKRIEAVHHRLPELMKLVRELQKRIERLEKNGSL
jgi:UDP-3-O-[3-hydroxymyristoyl] glucosamine N-acyltransferase